MNEKIPLQLLAKRVAEKSGADIATAQSFIKSIFANATQSLLNGDSVTLEGIGTFKISHSPENPIVFECDGELADQINAPFAIFEPVEISEEVSVDELDTVDLPVADDIEDLSDEEVKAQEIVSDIDESSSDMEVLTDEVSNEAVAESIDLNENNVTENTIVEDAVTLSEPIVDVVEGIIDVPEIPETETTEPEITYIPEQEEEFVEYHIPKSRFGLGYFLGIVTGLVIAALAIAAYTIYTSEALKNTAI